MQSYLKVVAAKSVNLARALHRCKTFCSHGHMVMYIFFNLVGKQSSQLRMTLICNNTLNEGWCESVVWDLDHITIHLMKGGVRLWCETWRRITIHSMKAGVRLWCETWLGEEAGARNRVFFRLLKWLQPALKGTSCVRRVRLGSFRA